MAEAARQEFANQSAAATALLAADVGGTYARIGLVNVGAGAPQVSTFERYRCADFASLAAIFERFLADHAHARVSRGAIAIAGYVLDDTIINNNLPWSVSLDADAPRTGPRRSARSSTISPRSRTRRIP